MPGIPIKYLLLGHVGSIFRNIFKLFSFHNKALLFTIQVNSAFNGKRKMLRKSLQHICTSLEIESALGIAGLPATVSISEADITSLFLLLSSLHSIRGYVWNRFRNLLEFVYKIK